MPEEQNSEEILVKLPAVNLTEAEAKEAIDSFIKTRSQLRSKTAGKQDQE